MSSTIASLIDAADQGDTSVAKTLFSELYSELHRLANHELHRRGAAGLGATTLLHEAYLDISSRTKAHFPDQGRFMAYAAHAMRGLIIDNARRNQTLKRGGQFEITSLPADLAMDPVNERELSRISDALDELAKSDPTLAQLVDLKFFCGFSFAEIAAMQNLTERTIQRRWEKARIYLYHSIQSKL